MLRSIENPHGEPDAWTFWNLPRPVVFFEAGYNGARNLFSGKLAFSQIPSAPSDEYCALMERVWQGNVRRRNRYRVYFTFATIAAC
jgi:hypothetical protein